MLLLCVRCVNEYQPNMGLRVKRLRARFYYAIDNI